MTDLVIIGAGGMGSEALWAASDMGGWNVLGFADDNPARTSFCEMPVLGSVGHILESATPAAFYCAIGNNAVRRRIFGSFRDRGWKPATLVHPSVITGPGATIGEGTYVGAGSILCPNSRLGSGVLVNCHVTVGHDSVLGDFAQACPGVRVNGNCRIGEEAFLGSNASVMPGVKVGRNVRVGSNSFVISNVADDRTMVGVPARSL